MRPIKILLFIIVGVSTILTGFVAWKLFAPADHPEVNGSLTFTELEGQHEAIDLYFQKQHAHPICVHEFYGRDEEAIFIDQFCGTFEIKKNEVETISGVRSPVRVEYSASPFTVTGFTTPEEGDFYPGSVVRMIPQIVYDAHIKQPREDSNYPLLMNRVKAKLENLQTP